MSVKTAGELNESVPNYTKEEAILGNATVGRNRGVSKIPQDLFCGVIFESKESYRGFRCLQETYWRSLEVIEHRVCTRLIGLVL